jgi:hypothetical protein
MRLAGTAAAGSVDYSMDTPQQWWVVVCHNMACKALIRMFPNVHPGRPLAAAAAKAVFEMRCENCGQESDYGFAEAISRRVPPEV